MKGADQFRRFGGAFIIQHIVLFVSVLLLIVSGVPLKFPESAFARWVIAAQGGMEMRAHIHHIAGMTLVGLGIFHFIYYIFIDRRIPFFKRAILPRRKDFGDAAAYLAYVVGRRKTIPPMGRYTWFEKLDYFGLLWGFAVMGVSGLAMLYMDIVLNFIPLSWLQILWAAHSEEAMLATLFLLIIHMYHVHFNPEKFPMSLTWLHGKISREEMEKYHPLELEQLENFEEPEPPKTVEGDEAVT